MFFALVRPIRGVDLKQCCQIHRHRYYWEVVSEFTVLKKVRERPAERAFSVFFCREGRARSSGTGLVRTVLWKLLLSLLFFYVCTVRKAVQAFRVSDDEE